MPLSDEDAAALRDDLEKLQREVGAAEAANREYEAKLKRLQKERSLGTSFDGQGGGGLADCRGTAATTMGSMWTRGVSVGCGLRQGLFYLPRSVVPKFPGGCPPYVYIAWERRFGAFVANQVLGHPISPDAPQTAVISCVDDAYLFGHFGEALVTEHARVWGYISEATAGAPFENRLYECHSVLDALRTTRKWALFLQPAERYLPVAELEEVQFIGDEGPKFFFARISRLETTMRAVCIKKSEPDIVQIILRQLPERYDIVKIMALADPQLTRSRLENTIRSAYSQRKAHEIAKQWPAVGAPAETPNPHALVVGRGFRDGGAVGGGGQRRDDGMVSRGGGMPRQHQHSSHAFPPARQARQQQPLQQPSRGIPTIGGDGEDGSSPLSETFFGGDGRAVEEWLQSDNMEMPMFSLSEGPQQSAPTAVALAATAPAAEAVTGTSVFSAVSSKGVVETPTSSMGAASAAVPAAAPPTGGTVFPTASMGGAARAPSCADETVALTAAPATSDTVPSAAPIRGAVGASRLLEWCHWTRQRRRHRRPAKLLPLMLRWREWLGSSRQQLGPLVKSVARGVSTHPFDPGTVFPLEVHYYKGSWLQHGSSSSSNSSSSGSSSSSNDNTSNRDSWWDATCVGALLRPFGRGKRCRWSARIGKAVLGLDLPFDRGKEWRRMRHGG